MRFYSFAALAILALTMGPIPQTDAGLLSGLGNALHAAGNLVGGTIQGVGNVAGGILHGAAHIAGDTGLGHLVGGVLNGAGNIAGDVLHGAGNIVGGTINGVGDILGGTLNIFGNTKGSEDDMKIGGTFLRPGGIILTLKGSDGQVIGHITSKSKSTLNILATFANNRFKVSKNNGSPNIQVTNLKSGLSKIIPNIMNIADITLKCGGDISLSLSTLGVVENDAQSILDQNGNVIDHLTQDGVHELLNGGIMILGAGLWKISQPTFVGLIPNLIGAIGSVVNIDGFLNIFSKEVNDGDQVVDNTANIDVGNTVDTLGNLPNELANIQIGGGYLSPGSKVITISGLDGKVIGHVLGIFVSTIEPLVTQSGGTIRLKAVNDNGSITVQLLNSSDKFLSTITNVLNIADTIVSCGGDIVLSINTLGEVANYAQSILDRLGNVIDKVAQDSIHGLLGGQIIIIGPKLWDLSRSTFEKLIPSLTITATKLVGGNNHNTIRNVICSLIIGSVREAMPKKDIVITGITDGTKVVSIRGGQNNNILAHLAGPCTQVFEILCTRFGGIVTLTRAVDGSGSVAVVDKSGNTGSLIAKPLAANIIYLLDRNGGKISLDINLIRNNAIVNNKGEVIDKIVDNDIITINTATGIASDKITIIGNGLQVLGADEEVICVNSLVVGAVQVVNSLAVNNKPVGSGSVSIGGSDDGQLGGSGSVSTGRADGGSDSSSGVSNSILVSLLHGSTGSTGGGSGGLLGSLNGAISTVGNIVNGAANIVDNTVHGAINTVVNVVDGIVQILDNTGHRITVNIFGNSKGSENDMKIGGSYLRPGGAILTLKGSDGQVVGHVTSRFKSTKELLAQLGGIRFKAVKNNGATAIQVTNSNGGKSTIIPNMMHIEDFTLKCGGEVSVFTSTLGDVVNGVQLILDRVGNVIDRVNQEAVHAILEGALIITGDKLWSISRDSFAQLVPSFIGKIVNSGVGKFDLRIIENMFSRILDGCLSTIIKQVIEIGQVVGNTVGQVVGNGGNRVDTLGNLPNEDANLQIGGGCLSPGTKVVTISGLGGQVIGHVLGGFVGDIESLATELNGTIHLKAGNNNDIRNVQLLNSNGEYLTTFSNAVNMADIIVACGGETISSISTLGEVKNGAQSILDRNGNVIGQLTLSVLHAVLGGEVVIIGNPLWVYSYPTFEKLIPKLISTASTIGVVDLKEVRNVASNLINGAIREAVTSAKKDIIISGIPDGTKVVSIRDAQTNNILAHLAGACTQVFEILCKRFGGFITLTRAVDGSGSVAVVDISGNTGGFIAKPLAANIIYLLDRSQGKISLYVNLIRNNAIVTDKGELVDKIVDNDIITINTATGIASDKITIIGNGLQVLGADEEVICVNSLVVGAVQVVNSLAVNNKPVGPVDSGSGSVSTGGSDDGQLGGSGSVSTGHSDGGSDSNSGVSSGIHGSGSTGGGSGGQSVILNLHTVPTSGLLSGLVGSVGNIVSGVSTSLLGGGLLGGTISGLSNTLLGGGGSGGLHGGLSSSALGGGGSGGLLGGTISGLSNSLLGGGGSGGLVGGTISGLSNSILGGGGSSGLLGGAISGLSSSVSGGGGSGGLLGGTISGLSNSILGGGGSSGLLGGAISGLSSSLLGGGGSGSVATASVSKTHSSGSKVTKQPGILGGLFGGLFGR